MSAGTATSDEELLKMLRSRGPLGVIEISHAMDVTPTAIRQRLGRMMSHGLIRRDAIRAGRGRPRHRYQLTEQGLRLTGSNFADLALALWREVAAIEDLELRRTLLARVVKALAGAYARQIEGRTVAERMESLCRLLGQRRLPFSVGRHDTMPVLTAHVCPYPDLAEEDRSICVFERMLFSELLGQEVVLAECRLESGSCCRFEPA